MAGRRKDKFIKDIHFHGITATVQMYLTTEDKFQVTWKPKEGGPVHLATEDTANLAQSKAYNVLKDMLALDWEPAIQVQFPTPSFVPSGTKFVMFSFERGYMAYSEYRKRWMWESWFMRPDERRGSSVEHSERHHDGYRYRDELMPPAPVSLPFEYQYKDADNPENNRDAEGFQRRGPVYMKYTEEKWNALNDLAARVALLNRLLREVVSDPELIRLQAMLTPSFNPPGELLALAAPNRGDSSAPEDAEILEGELTNV